MKDLRALLIDCRIELRKASREFQKSELCERIDLAIQAVTNAGPGADITPDSHSEGVANVGDKAQTVSQVALAWQTASRDLKFSDPAIHARLSDKVMRLLAQKVLVDPSTEIVQLEQKMAAMQLQLADLHKANQRIETERDAVLGALATAVPVLKDGGDRLGVALARVNWLKAESEKGATRTSSSSSSGPSRSAEPSDPMPTQELLAAVAANAATLTKEQREWCIGEAMVVTGFQFTPVELIEKGDATVAKMIIDARAKG
jgi:hypothetical protein